MKNPQIAKEYRVKTSVRLKTDHIETLKQTAKEIGLSMNDLMVLLLRFANERFSFLPRFSLTKYQKSQKNFKAVNLCIGQWDYERNLDTRLYARVSISWLLAYAIENFLHDALKKWKKEEFGRVVYLQDNGQ